MKALALFAVVFMLSTAQAQSPEVSTVHTGIQCRFWNGFPESSKLTYVMGYAEGLEAGSNTFFDILTNAGQTVSVDNASRVDAELDRKFSHKLTFAEIAGRLNRYCSAPENTSITIKNALVAINF